MTVTAHENREACRHASRRARDEREAAARVQQMFGDIAPRYDFLNHCSRFRSITSGAGARRSAFGIFCGGRKRGCWICAAARAISPSRSTGRAPRCSGESRVAAAAGVRQRFRRADARARPRKAQHGGTRGSVCGRRRAASSVCRRELRSGDHGFRLSQSGELRERPARDCARAEAGGEVGILEFTEPGTARWPESFASTSATSCRESAARFPATAKPTRTCRFGGEVSFARPRLPR